MLQMCGKRCKERVADGGHDDTDQIRTIMIQIAGKLVRHIIEQLHGFAHTFAHVIRHVPVAVHHQRDGAQRHPGLLRHIAHADHDRTFPVITVLSLYAHVLTANITFIYILSNLFDSPATKYSFLVSTPAEARAFSSGLVWSNAITSVASGLAALMAVALRFLSRYSATVRVT